MDGSPYDNAKWRIFEHTQMSEINNFRAPRKSTIFAEPLNKFLKEHANMSMRGGF